ncbi:ATP synthase F0 [Beauveria bassiana ARSEF 2860]|uniref:ATP synthase F0 n=1 Tax=Beauveria bassiana (strain ARSEF 2860) TaxID=655819 RepID=J4KKX5_BEAB2|nr:ATP synthase F0 [Beauveria bassiana ARSEF 2860]EJP61214.1 ATP synthase F0 [Beauveria bassiana ARSEF 2860]
MAFVANATAEINVQTQYKIIITICLVMTSLSVVIVGTRLSLRWTNNTVAADDFMALLGLVFAGVYSVLCIIRTYYSITGIIWQY